MMLKAEGRCCFWIKIQIRIPFEIWIGGEGKVEGIFI